MKKKIFAAVTLAALPLLVTGCGGKKLVCTQKEDNMEVKYSISFKIKLPINYSPVKYSVLVFSNSSSLACSTSSAVVSVIISRNSLKDGVELSIVLNIPISDS